MKPTLKTGFATLLLIAVSCRKESVNKDASSISQNSTQQGQTFTIGQHYGGGIIFYIDSTNKHGLIADTGDLARAEWWNPLNATHAKTGATHTEIGWGLRNTKKIFSTEGDSGLYAARECLMSTRGGYTDWFLPTKDELTELYLQKDVVGGFTTATHGHYWSSSRQHKYAWKEDFDDGDFYLGYQGGTVRVRAVRAF